MNPTLSKTLCVAAALSVPSLVACNGQLLDGGSSSTESASASNSDGGADIPDADADTSRHSDRVAGSIAGRSFDYVSAEIEERLSGERVLTIRNYESRCGELPGGKPEAASAMVITVGDLTSTRMSRRIPNDDKEQATFQVGVYDDSAKATLIAVRKGFVDFSFDTNRPEAGDWFPGELSLDGDNAHVEGLFEARYCP